MSMEGKVCLITGATAGIGEVAAQALAGMGAQVVGVGRDAGRCASSARRIQQTSGSSHVEYLVADLSSRQEVRRLASEFRQHYSRLDVLVNNAGAYFYRRQESPDGIEMTFALNHLAYFFLTGELLDLIKASVPARIVNVSSEAHRGSSIHFADLQGKRRYSGYAAYGQSKLANVLFTYELARRLEGQAVTANVLHPGFVATRFGHNNGWLVSKVLGLVQKIAARTPEQGAETIIYLASSPDVDGLSGMYFVDRRPLRSSPESYDVETAQRLWKESAQMAAVAA